MLAWSLFHPSRSKVPSTAAEAVVWEDELLDGWPFFRSSCKTIQQGHCWRSLTHIYNHQFMSKMGEINKLWYICINYWPSSTCISRKYVLQINTEKRVKMHKIKKKAESRNVFLEMRKERMEKPNFTWQPRPSTTARGAQALPPAHLAKTVARRASQGAATP